MSDLQIGDVIAVNNYRNAYLKYTGTVGKIIDIITEGSNILFKIKPCHIRCYFQANLYPVDELIKLDLDDNDIKIVTKTGSAKTHRLSIRKGGE